MTKTEKFKQHMQEHRVTYIVGAGCLVVGAAGAVLVMARRGCIGSPEQTVDVLNKTQGIFWHSPVTNVVQTTLERRGHPGNIIRCDQTGEVFASQGRAADLMGLNSGNLSAHLTGRSPHIKGLTFTKLGEAA